MKSEKKKITAQTIARQRRSRHRLLAFSRTLRYGTDSFLRNSWLSVAATAVMTITLLIIFTSFVARTVLTDTVGTLRDKVDMSIYLKTETTDQQGADLSAELKKLSSVRSVTYVSADAARKQMIDDNKSDQAVIDAITAATNKNPATLRVVVDDINDTAQLEDFVKNNTMVKDHLSADYKPSFAGERRNTIQSIGRAVDFAQQVGIIAGSVFVGISALIIFNTIRMAIFNRKEEIQMMKLIGADKSFIRGPFLVESIIYGFIAAFVATGLGYWGLTGLSGTLSSYQITVQPTIDLVTGYGWLVLLAMITIGAVIGIISSLFATHKYLKI